MLKLSILFISLMLSYGLNAQISVIAHRGASHLAPENTLAAIALAFDLNADLVEIDVRLTADHQIMLMHDANTKRTSKGKNNYLVSQTLSSTLDTIKVGSSKYPDETIPYLSDAFELVPQGKRLAVEIKCGEEILPALKDLFTNNNNLSKCEFSSFNWNTICAVKDVFPEADCYLITAHHKRIKKTIKKCQENEIDGLSMYRHLITKRKLKWIKTHHLKIIAWPINSQKKYHKMKRLGVDAVTTNHIELFQNR